MGEAIQNVHGVLPNLAAPYLRKRKTRWGFGVFAAVALLFVIIFPGVWGFQVIRSLHYDIVRDPVSWQCSGCHNQAGNVPPENVSAPVAGAQTAQTPQTPPDIPIRAFVGYPPTEGPQSSAEPGTAGKSTYFRIWYSNLPGHVPGENQGYRIRIGEKEFAAAFVSGKNPSAERLLPQGGEVPGARFVYFVFLNTLSSDAAWASAELRPNLIVLNWADPAAYILHAFSLADMLLSLGAAVFLVLVGRYLLTHYRRVFSLRLPPRGSRPGALFYGTALAAALSVCAAYAFPWFHNVVFLYFSLLAITWIVLHRLFLRAKNGTENKDRAPRPVRPSPSYIAALLLILVAAFGLRAYKADWGFPLLLHTDEYAITNMPSQMAAHNSLDPIDFERPNHGSIYLNSILYGVASEVRFHRPIQETFDKHQVFYTFLSRISVALLGTLSVWLAFLIGAEFHPRVGLLAALLFALFPQFVVHSHYTTPDISSALLLQGVVLFSLRYLRFPSAGNLLYACACAAAATAEKYPGVLTLLGIAAALWVVHRRNRERLTVLMVRGGAAYFGFLFLMAPFIVLKPHVVLLNLISEGRPAHAGHDGLGFFGNLMFYVHTYAGSTSFILTVFAAVGVAAMWLRYRLNSLPVFLGLVFWVGLSLLPLYWERWDLPMVVTPLLLAAYGMHTLWEASRAFKQAGPRFVLASAALLLFAAASVNLLLKDCVVLADFQSRDTRVIGTAVLDSMGVSRDNALVGHYTPLAPVWKRGFDFITSFNNPEIMRGRDYAVVSSNLYGRYFQEPAKYPGEVEFYKRLFAYPLLLDLKPSPMPERFAAFNDFSNIARAYPAWRDYAANRQTFSVGPEIRVYRLNDVGLNNTGLSEGLSSYSQSSTGLKNTKPETSGG